MKRGNEAVAEVVSLEARRAARLELGDGAVATVEAGALELRDREGRLLVRYADGCAEIAAPAGDLVLNAPVGRVVVRAAKGVDIATERVHVEAAEAELVAGVVATSARAVATRAETIALAADCYELVANRLFERTKDAFRDVADLAQTRVGRARTLVESVFTLKTRRTVMASKEDTSIDGRKILLG